MALPQGMLEAVKKRKRQEKQAMTIRRVSRALRSRDETEAPEGSDFHVFNLPVDGP